MRRQAGFTLIEMAVVLGIIAILAAVLTPIVTAYVDQARSARADADTAAIASAILQYRQDTGRFPIFDTLTAARSNTAAKPCMVSGTGTSLPAGANHASWTALCTSMAPIQQYLNVNSLGINSVNAAGGGVTYRGPYLDGLNGTDPWGQPYVITASHLTTPNLWAFVVSAGPSTGLDTPASQSRSTALATTGDDILALIH